MSKYIPAARTSNPNAERVTDSGTRIPTNHGKGWAPMTLSTMTFKGSGVSNASGVLRKFTRNLPEIGSQ